MGARPLVQQKRQQSLSGQDSLGNFSPQVLGPLVLGSGSMRSGAKGNVFRAVPPYLAPRLSDAADQEVPREEVRCCVCFLCVHAQSVAC